jgi:hypothetical protein
MMDHDFGPGWMDAPDFAGRRLCSVAVAVGVGVAAAAAAAQAGLAASQSGKSDAPGAAGIPGPTRSELQAQESTRQLLGEGRRTAEAGVGLQGQLEPELLRALGYDVEATDNRAGISEAAAAVQAAQANASAIQGRINELKAGMQQARASGAKGGLRPSKRAKRMLVKERNAAQSEIQRLEGELGRLQTNPFTITGVSRTPTEAETNQAEIEQRLSERGLAALAGELPDNPKLLRDLSEQEAVLRQRLARDLGTGYESTTIGNDALRTFEQRKQEILEDDRYKTINQLIPLGSGLSSDILNRTIGRQNASSQIARERFLGTDALAGLADAYTRSQQPQQALRGEKGAAARQKAELDAAAKARKDAAYQQAISTFASGATNAAGAGLASSGSSVSAASSTPGVGGNSSVGPYASGYRYGSDYDILAGLA